MPPLPAGRLILLGPVQLLLDGRPLSLEPRERDLLVALALAGTAGATRATLERQLWPGETNLDRRWWTLSSQLRRKLQNAGLPGAVRSEQRRYRLGLLTLTTDLEDFHADAERARYLLRDGRTEAAADAYRDALGRWSGEALDGVLVSAFDVAAAGWERERRDILLALAGPELGQDPAEQIVPMLTDAVARHPADQLLTLALARALDRAGRRATAIDVLRDLLGRLSGQGEQPTSAVTESLAELERPVPAGTTGSRPAAPPPPPRPLLAREAEVTAAVTALTARDGALVALAGSPGTGKTAVLLAVADRLLPELPLQVFVDLGTAAGQVTSDDVLGTVARELGEVGPLPITGVDRRALVRRLVGDRRMLLVLDNVSRADQLDGVLRVRWGAVVITCRSAAEIPPGATPVPVERFSRATSVEVLRRFAEAKVAADPDGAARVAAACGGLAVSLWPIAAQLRTPPWSASELAGVLEDETARMTRARRREPGLLASLQVAYEGLGPAAQDAFEHLGLTGRLWVTRWSAAALLGTSEAAAEEALNELVEAYLLRWWRRPDDELGRYRMQSLPRLYAGDRFAERATSTADASAAAGRLARAYRERAERVEVALHRQGVHPCGPPARPDVPPAEPALVRWLDDERAPAAAAVELALDHDAVDEGVGLARSMMAMLEAGGHYERWGQLGARARDAAQDPSVCAALDAGLGTQQHYVRQLPKSRASLERAIAVWTDLADPVPAAYAQLVLAMTLRAQRKPGPEAAALVAAMQIAEGAEDSVLTTQALRCLAWPDRDTDRSGLAMERLVVARRRAETISGPQRLLGYVLRDLGVMQTDAGDVAGAEDSLTRALAIFTGLGDTHWEALTLLRLGELQVRQHRDQEARPHLDRAITLSKSRHDRSVEADALRHLAVLDARAGDRTGALDRFSTALSVADDLGDTRQRAFTLVVRGEVLLDGGAAEDRDQARADLTEAAAILAQGGVVSGLRRAEAGLARLT